MSDQRARGAQGDAPGYDGALLAACRLIGEHLRVDIKTPAATAARSRRDTLEAIAEASRLRTRRVALRGAWWNNDNGPLLGHLENGRRPVALLPGRGGRYYLSHPAVGAPQPMTAELTAELAAALDPFATQFYRTLPDRPVSARDLLLFGLAGGRRDLAVVVLTGLALGGLSLAPALAIGAIFDAVIPAGDRSLLLQVTVGLLLAAVAVGLFQIVRDLALLRLEGRLSQAIQSGVWDRLLNLPASFFAGFTAGDLAARAAGLDDLRRELAGVTLSTLLTGAFSCINLALLWVLDPRLGLVGTAAVAVVATVTALAGRRALGDGRALHRAQARLAGLVLQLVGGVARLRVAGAEGRAFGVWRQRFTEQRRLANRVRRVAIGLATFSIALPPLTLAALFVIVAANLGTTHALSTGAALAAVAASAGLLAALFSLSTNALAVLRAWPLFENALPILSTGPEIGPDRADPGELSGGVEAVQVSFRYRPEGPLVLDDLSLEIRPGEFVAIAGPSGSGKSTLLRLLLGFEAPEAGSIRYDGRELGALDATLVRRQVGVVLQNSSLMPGDLFSNIAGALPISLDEAWEALRLAGLEADVRGMPMGLHTVVGEGGTTFSAGQRQRLLIARAIVKRPRLLFFDEATSALDNRTQAVVSRSLAALAVTRVVIAHRLSTVAGADRICVLHGGRLAQMGSYAELAESPGLFRDLMRRQVT